MNKEKQHTKVQEDFLDEAVRRRQVDNFIYEFIFCLAVGALGFMIFLTFFGNAETKALLGKFWSSVFGKLHEFWSNIRGS